MYRNTLTPMFVQFESWPLKNCRKHTKIREGHMNEMSSNCPWWEHLFCDDLNFDWNSKQSFATASTGSNGSRKIESPSCNFWALKEMFGKVNRSFRTLNDCDMLCSGDAKCWHHVCSLFVTLLAQLAWWTIDRRARHSGCQSAPGVQVLGSLSRSWEQRRRVGGIVSRLVFHL